MERKLCVWLNKQYQCRINPNDRRSFVDALSDGIILCKLMRDLSGNNKLKFNDVSKTARRGTVSGGVYAKNENIQTFSSECLKRGIDSVVTVSPSDFQDGGNPGKVMACLMNLYRKSAEWPGRIKMVLMRPRLSRSELVTDYLGTLKAVRRTSLTGASVTELFAATRMGTAELDPPPLNDAASEAKDLLTSTRSQKASWRQGLVAEVDVPEQGGVN